MDYMRRSIMENPFDGLSLDERRRMMIFYTVVREPVLTAEEVKARWNVELGVDEQLPVFKVAEIAEEIRAEILVHSRRTMRLRLLCVVMGVALVASLAALLATYAFLSQCINERDAARIACTEAQTDCARLKSERDTQSEECRKKIEEVSNACAVQLRAARQSWNEETVATGMAFKAQLDLMRQSCAEKIKSVVEMHKKDIAKLQDVHGKMKKVLLSNDQGKISDRKAIAEINDLLLPPPQNQEQRGNLCEKAEQLLGQAKQALDNNDIQQSFRIAKSIEAFLTLHMKNPDQKAAYAGGTHIRLDLENSMLWCYKKAAEKIPSARFRMAVLYGAHSFCRSENYSGYIVGKNDDVARVNLLMSCQLDNLEALRLEFEALSQDSEDDRYWWDQDRIRETAEHTIIKVPFWWTSVKAGLAIVDNDEATGDDICKVAKWFDKYAEVIYKSNISRQAIPVTSAFRLAARKGNAEAKQWLLKRGLEY